jgi:hypothetical protein
MNERNLGLVLIAVLIASTACGGDDGSATGDGGTARGDSAVGMDGTVGTDSRTGSDAFTVDPSGRVVCPDGQPCACDNGIDDDGDGLVDGADPECTGPYDDDEGSFATGIPGDNVDFCQDCFFDGNSGMGDDGCAYHTDCLYGETPPGMGGADCFSCEVSDQCVNFCRARTPNGCDCFGCCEVQTDDGSSVNVYLTSSCSLDAIDDTDACPRCEQSPDCYNECGECELCPGRTIEDLPASCYDDPDGGTPMYTCDDGEQMCNETTRCPEGYYCQQGCCLVADLI